MKKPFNVRLPVLFAASMCAGIIYSTVLAYFRVSGVFILLPSCIAFAACIPVAIIKGGVSGPLIIIGVTAFFLCGAIYLFAEYVIFDDFEVLQTAAVRVSGKVSESGVTSAGNRYLILTDVTVNGGRISGKVAAYLGEKAGEYCRRGYTVNFYTQLEKQNFIEYGSVGYNAVRGVKYICTVSGGMQSTYRFDLFGEINYAIERALFNNLDGETAAVCYAMLTGNTDAISENTLTAFRNGGVAHIFAVSGLHIGVIFGALTFIFKKLRINRYVSTALRIAVIFIYSGICLFSASSVRALVMCSVSAVARCFYRKHDSLNALALAAVIVLLINPLQLFSVGFMLSFSAVLGILVLGKNVGRLLGFLPEKIGNALSVGVSAQISIIPVQLTSFGYFSAAGIALNPVFIPVISVLYILLFICACVSLIIPAAAGVLLPFSALPIELIINLMTESGFENAIVSGNAANWLYVPFALLIIGLTDKLNLRPFLRSACTCVFALLLLVSSTVPKPSDGLAVVEFNTGYHGGSAKIATAQGTLFVVTENFELRSGISAEADVLIVLGGDDAFAAVTELGKNYDRVYMRGSAPPVPALGDTPVFYADSFTEYGVKFTYNDDALTADVYGIKISLIRNEDEYVAGKTGSDFELYSYRSKGAVLRAEGGSYALDICGTMRYEISAMGYNSSHVVPKE